MEHGVPGDVAPGGDVHGDVAITDAVLGAAVPEQDIPEQDVPEHDASHRSSDSEGVSSVTESDDGSLAGAASDSDLDVFGDMVGSLGRDQRRHVESENISFQSTFATMDVFRAALRHCQV